MAPLLSLAPCFGFDQDTFEIAVEHDHIVMSINRAKNGEFKEC